MPNFQRIQDCIDQIAPLIREVEDLQPMSSTMIDGLPVEPSYSAEDLRNLEDKIKTWKAVTTEILIQEVGESNPRLFDFSSRWRAPLRDYNFKTRLKKKLQNAKSDLRILLAVEKEKDEAQPRYDEIWAIIHPAIIAVSRDRMEDGYYADAVEAACKGLNSRVREIVKAKTGEELDGASLMQKAFSPANPIIRLNPGKTVSDQDTQKGYMQIFAGVMTGIRNPKAHDNETISREDTLRKLAMISILMYKLDKATTI